MDYIKNPNSGRMVKVGGRAWRKLVDEGLLEDNYNNPNELYELKEDDDINELKRRYENELNLDYKPVKGRGRYSNKLMKRKITKPLNINQTGRIIRKTKYKVKENPDIDDEELEHLILRETPLRRQESGNYERNIEIESEYPEETDYQETDYPETEAETEYYEEQDDDNSDIFLSSDEE